jgi:hypothetical protein
MMPSISASASKAVDMEKAKATVDYPIEKLDASEDDSQLKEVGERSSDSAWEKQEHGEDDNKFKEASKRRFRS